MSVGGAGVESQFGGLVVAQAQVLFLDAQAQQPVLAGVLPIGEPFQVGAGFAEKLALHLLELTGAEGEVAGGDLVAERLAHLADAEGQLAAGGALDVGEVHKDALGGLRPQVAGGGGILSDADGGLEHQVELADGGEIVLAADRADHFLVAGDESVHLVKGHGVHVHALALLTVGDQLVGAVAALAGAGSPAAGPRSWPHARWSPTPGGSSGWRRPAPRL